MAPPIASRARNDTAPSAVLPTRTADQRRALRGEAKRVVLEASHRRPTGCSVAGQGTIRSRSVIHELCPLARPEHFDAVRKTRSCSLPFLSARQNPLLVTWLSCSHYSNSPARPCARATRTWCGHCDAAWIRQPTYVLRRKNRFPLLDTMPQSGLVRGGTSWDTKDDELQSRRRRHLLLGMAALPFAGFIPKLAFAQAPATSAVNTTRPCRHGHRGDRRHPALGDRHHGDFRDRLGSG